MTTRAEHEPTANGTETQTTVWQYFETWPHKGLLSSIEYPGQTIYYNYDTHQRINRETVTFDGENPYETRYGYDEASRLAWVHYPSGFAHYYDYNTIGHLYRLSHNYGYSETYRLEQTTPWGQAERYSLDRDIFVNLEYHSEKHKLTHILTTHGENILQNLRYDYDGFSNLASRKDEERDMEETFTYDHLNRLTGIWRNSFRTGWMDYDEYGRMTRKVIDNSLVFTNAVYDESTKPHAIDRGFTGHEHLYAFGLINMNGRCYDPLTSSFLSVDAYVQDPTNAQSFNRYAYCSHNPLRYTDPTGWYQQTGSGYNINPKANLIGTTTYQSDDPCDMLWGRSVHPCKDGDPDGTIITSSGFMIGNSFVTSCNGPLGQLQAIMNYINSPGEYTAMILQAMNIDMTAGFTCGSYQGMEGFRLSNYSWTDASGQSYHADVFEYIGGDFNGHYITGNEPAARFRNENYNGVPNAFDYGISYAGVVTSFIKDKWENPGSRAQKAINQKKAYKIQKTLKAKGITKSVKEIKAGKIVNLKAGGNALGVLGLGVSMYDPIINKEIKPSNIYDMTTSATCLALSVFFASNPAGWIAGTIFLGAEVCSYAFTGQSIGEHLDQNISWRRKFY